VVLLFAAGAVLGPLLIARVRRFGPSPRGIEVRPDAPKLDMAVVVDAHPDDAKALVATLNGMRPQPAHIVIEPGATPPEGVEYVIEMAPDVVFATPEACDRIAHALDTHPSIAAYPWVKTAKPADALQLTRTLFDALSAGPFAAVTLSAKWLPTTFRAYRAGHASDRPVVSGGGHVVAQPVGPRSAGAPNPVSATLAAAYLVMALGAPFVSLWLYPLYVLSLSACLKQIAKFPRASALFYPVVLTAGLVAPRQKHVVTVKPQLQH
jgi:hypothetical protein